MVKVKKAFYLFLLRICYFHRDVQMFSITHKIMVTYRISQFRITEVHMCSQYRNNALKLLVSRLLKYTYLYTVILVSLGMLLL